MTKIPTFLTCVVQTTYKCEYMQLLWQCELHGRIGFIIK